MVSNLAVENLSRAITSPGGGGAEVGSEAMGPQISEARVLREMETQGLQPARETVGDSNRTFSDVLRKSVDQVNTYQHEADRAIKELAAGRTKNIHETLVTIERADTSLKMMMQVRNKILDAYREIMRMQV